MLITLQAINCYNFTSIWTKQKQKEEGTGTRIHLFL